MNVVHVGTIDEGGAYYAMVRIHESLILQGVSSKILLRNKSKVDSEGDSVEIGINRFVSKCRNALNLLLSTKDVQIDFFGSNICNQEAVQRADVVIIHWANSFVSYNELLRLSKCEKKVIFVMHDMWYITAGCHNDEYCGKYKYGCKECEKTHFFVKKELFEKVFKIKQRALESLNPMLVSPSRWLLEEANKSLITKDLKKCIIRNPLDFTIFHPISDKEDLYKKYGLIKTKKYVLFSALKATTNKNKGFEFVVSALKKYGIDDIELLVCGNEDLDDNPFKADMVPIRYFGIINNPRSLAEIYNVANVFVAASFQDNYPNSVAEAMSCGTPAVAFSIGGMPDLIDHKKNGYLVDYGDTDELLKGIVYCIDNEELLSSEALRARLEANSLEIIGKQYLKLLENIVGK